MDWKEIMLRKRYLTENQKFGLKVLITQMVYLSLNFPWLSLARNFMQVIDRMGISLLDAFIYSHAPDFFFLPLAATYPFISLFSFCTFLWASSTGRLQNKAMKRIYHLPLILVIVIIAVHILVSFTVPIRSGGVTQLG